MNEIDRLLGAIERLLEAEALALRAGNVANAVAMQQRVAPVIQRLVALVSATGLVPAAPARLAERVHRVRERRRENLHLLVALRSEREQVRERLKLAGERLRRLKPAYGCKPRRIASFSAAG